MNHTSDHPDEESPLLRDATDNDYHGDDDKLELGLIIGIGFTWFASFLAALDSTITTTISATVANEFGSLSIISWMASAYLIALTATQPLSGKLTDIYGRRSGFIFSVVLFGAGNCVCGLSQSIPVLVIGRVLAGIGGGGCNSISTFIGNDLIPVRSRGVWQGAGNVVYAIGIGLGGVVGGSINQSIGWRWAFIILIPLSMLSAVGVVLFLPPLAAADTGPRLKRIDFAGSFLLVASLSAFLIGLNQETHESLILKITLPVAAGLFVLFILVEIRIAKEPVIPMRLLRSRTVTAACLSGWFTSMCMYTMLFYVPLYFQVRGFGTAKTGALLVPEPMGAAVGSFGAGAIMRATGRYGVLKFFAQGVFLLGAGGYAWVNFHTPLVIPELSLFCGGLGIGSILTVMMIALLSAIEQDDQAVATSLFYAFRSTGSTIGVTVSSTLFRFLLSMRTDESVRDTRTALALPKFDGNRPWADKDAFLYALHGTFILATGYAIFGFLCGIATKNNELSSKIGKRNRR